MFWKETDSTDIRSVEAVHGGDGVIRMHQFFKGKSSVGVNFHVWGGNRDSNNFFGEYWNPCSLPRLS